jgi:hypothetical protein
VQCLTLCIVVSQHVPLQRRPLRADEEDNPTVVCVDGLSLRAFSGHPTADAALYVPSHWSQRSKSRGRQKMSSLNRTKNGRAAPGTSVSNTIISSDHWIGRRRASARQLWKCLKLRDGVDPERGRDRGPSLPKPPEVAAWSLFNGCALAPRRPPVL